MLTVCSFQTLAVLTGASPNTAYTITASKLTGSLTITTDGSGNGNNEAVFTSSFTGACTTDPLRMGPTTGYDLTAGQINHVWVGTRCGTTPPSGVPQFPAPARMGFAILMLFMLPVLYGLKRARPISRSI